MKLHGTEDTKDEAKAAFGRTLRKWLEHVGAKDLTAELLERHRIGARSILANKR